MKWIIKNEINSIAESKEEENRLNSFLNELEMQIEVTKNKRIILKNSIYLKDNKCQSIMGEINNFIIE